MGNIHSNVRLDTPETMAFCLAMSGTPYYIESYYHSTDGEGYYSFGFVDNDEAENSLTGETFVGTVRGTATGSTVQEAIQDFYTLIGDPRANQQTLPGTYHHGDGSVDVVPDLRREEYPYEDEEEVPTQGILAALEGVFSRPDPEIASNVSDDDILEQVSVMTGIPRNRLVIDERHDTGESSGSASVLVLPEQGELQA